MNEYWRHAQADAERRLSDAEQKAKRDGVSCDAVKVEDRQPFEAIIETAEARGCDLIVMASHGPRGITALLIGSETMRFSSTLRSPNRTA